MMQSNALQQVTPSWNVRLWRMGLQLYFRLFQRHRHNRLVLEHVTGRPLLVLPEVLNPQLFRSGAFFAGVLGPGLIPPGARVLDMGTGSGVCAVVAAQWAGEVVAVDINPEAVRCAQLNMLLNRVEARVHVRHGDLFAPVAGECFDVVLFNPPYLPGTPKSLLDRALYAEDVIARFAADLRGHLAPGGAALLLLSTIGDMAGQLALFRAQGFTIETVAEHALVGETMAVKRLSV